MTKWLAVAAPCRKAAKDCTYKYCVQFQLKVYIPSGPWPGKIIFKTFLDCWKEDSNNPCSIYNCNLRKQRLQRYLNYQPRSRCQLMTLFVQRRLRMEGWWCSNESDVQHRAGSDESQLSLRKKESSHNSLACMTSCRRFRNFKQCFHYNCNLKKIACTSNTSTKGWRLHITKLKDGKSCSGTSKNHVHVLWVPRPLPAHDIIRAKKIAHGRWVMFKRERCSAQGRIGRKSAVVGRKSFCTCLWRYRRAHLTAVMQTWLTLNAGLQFENYCRLQIAVNLLQNI